MMPSNTSFSNTYQQDVVVQIQRRLKNQWHHKNMRITSQDSQHTNVPTASVINGLEWHVLAKLFTANSSPDLLRTLC